MLLNNCLSEAHLITLCSPSHRLYPYYPLKKRFLFLVLFHALVPLFSSFCLTILSFTLNTTVTNNLPQTDSSTKTQNFHTPTKLKLHKSSFIPSLSNPFATLKKSLASIVTQKNRETAFISLNGICFIPSKGISMNRKKCRTNIKL